MVKKIMVKNRKRQKNILKLNRKLIIELLKREMEKDLIKLR